ncbi:hypothetical protein [Chitinophaga sp. Cy-1792]|uniref:hypothetical protein n=1 Tax=Chitinophaga sp. Cy-1792 TaxID=2608339 RepID=UPI00141FC1CC|nr:hypothetical protein [Chitinophaga sp. Cy-1792]NIG55948.1 hypothetical protein [Chitinophaga sp. Cy-1792]
MLRLIKNATVAGLMMGAAGVTGCGTSMKLSIPTTFKEQATMEHVNGARGNKMQVSGISTSKIKRGIHLSSPAPGRTRNFFLENLFLNQVGGQLSETMQQEKAKFSYSISDGQTTLNIYAHEKELNRKVEYESVKPRDFLSGFEILQYHSYVFSAMITPENGNGINHWELLLSNVYDRQALHDNNPFAFAGQEDSGIATDGSDTIYLKPLSIKKTELSNGKEGKLPFKLFAGYELSTKDGVVAVVDLIDRNIWFYKELDASERLNISAIGTAIFARRVKDAKW